MLRNIFRYFCGLTVACLGTVGLSGCADDLKGLEIPADQLPESGYITLSMKCVEGTRAPEDDYTEDGVNSLNENWIEKVTICLWAKGGDKPDDTAKPDYYQTFTQVDKNNTATFRIPLTLALKNKLFETSGAECHAFAAVNIDVPEGEFTIADFRDKVVESTFSTQKRQASFTMDGDCVVSYNPVTNSASGNLDLQRSASKITLALDVDPIVEQTAIVDGAIVTSKWKADTSTMRVWLKGGLVESTLDPNLDAEISSAYFFDTPDDLTYTFKDNNSGENGAPDNGNNPPLNGETTRTYPYVQDVPFYTYPHRWTAEPDDYAATYMILSIPWMQVDDAGNQIAGTSWRTCYYQVPVIAENSDLLQLVRNVSYHVYLHVGLLGSFEPDVPLEIEELEYSAAEWGTVNMDVTIPNVRYLVVDQNDYTVNNETSINIPFYTSHETVVTDATMTFYRYNFDDVGRELPVVVTMAKNDLSATRAGAPVFTAYFNNETKELEVSHDLVMYEGMTSGNRLVDFTNGDGPNVGKAQRLPKTVADWNSLMNTISWFRKVQPTTTVKDVNEYSRVEYKITVQHLDLKGTPNFKEEITITQYPGMYITTVMNYCPTTSTTFTYTGANGNTFINGNSDDKGTTHHYDSGNINEGWMTSIGLSTSYFNFNPNMYLVTITTLSEGTPYRIGDPRSSTINNNLGSDKSYSNSYTGNLKTITTGVNGPLPTAENKTVWSGEKYGNIDVVGFDEGNSIYPNGGKRKIEYYYPAMESDTYKMMIAPKFRICSSYGGTGWILNRELARRRAAAYQEMGYAAGRWRLPTYGEVAFVMNLAAMYKIPRLFGANAETWYYWCAQGLVCVKPKTYTGSAPSTLPGDAEYLTPPPTPDNSGQTTNTSYSNPGVQRARFVYDEWYWGDADLPHTGTIGSADCVYTFTWGDKPMTTQN